MIPSSTSSPSAGLCNGFATRFAGLPNRPLAILDRSGESGSKNASFTLPSDGFYQIAPFGEFPGMLQRPDEEPLPITQVIDRAAMEAITAAWNDEQMVDYEHFSHQADRPTNAAGWIKELQLRDDGLYARITWSERGLKDVAGGNYRYISPEFEDVEDLGSDRWRPRLLTGAGLTNRPALTTLKPLSNRGQQTITTDKSPMDYKDLLIQLLGLAPEATDEEISQAAAARASTENREEDEEETERLRVDNAALRDALVEYDLDAHKAVINNRDEVKKQLLANREGTLSLLKGLKAPNAPRAPIYNRSTAKNPEPGFRQANAIYDRQAAAVQDYKLKNKCSYNDAWEAVRREKPELFREDDE